MLILCSPSKVDNIIKNMQKVTLSNIIRDIIVKESLLTETHKVTKKSQHNRQYNVQITFKKNLKDLTLKNWKAITDIFNKDFLLNLVRSIGDMLDMEKPPLIGIKKEKRSEPQEN